MENTYDLTNYGYTGIFPAYAAEYPGLIPARIISEEKELYRIISALGETNAKISGKYRYSALSRKDFPAVGDFVMIEPDISGDTAVIQATLPRKSTFSRKAIGKSSDIQIIASNIDTVFICMSLNNDFNLRRIERYLSAVWDSSSVPVIVLTKSDLCENAQIKLQEVEKAAVGTDIISCSCYEDGGLSELLPYLKKGRTVALTSSSGVGKSTIINRLIGKDLLSTNGLRDDDKGRHTTTRRELILLPCSCCVIDTPGMREFGMWDNDSGVGATFAEIEELFSKCKYTNCSHTSEPGCAVLSSISDGSLSEERWQSYLKLKMESSYSADSESYLDKKEKKFKNIAKINKQRGTFDK